MEAPPRGCFIPPLRGIYYTSHLILHTLNVQSASSEPIKTMFYEIPHIIVRRRILGVRNRHDGIIKWKHFPRYWPFVQGIHQSPVNSRHKGQWHGALMFSLICAWIDGWVNNRKAGCMVALWWPWGNLWFLPCLVCLGNITAAKRWLYNRRMIFGHLPLILWHLFAPSKWETSLQSNTVSHWVRSLYNVQNIVQWPFSHFTAAVQFCRLQGATHIK